MLCRAHASAQKESGPSLWDRINPFSAHNVRKFAEQTGIDKYENTPSSFTEDEKSLIFFLGSGGGAFPGRLTIPGSGSAVTESSGKFQLGYHPRVWQRATEDGVFHQFPLMVDKAVLATKPQVYSNGYRMYRLEGSMFGNSNLYKGNFELGVHRSGIIDHRMFRPFNPK